MLKLIESPSRIEAAGNIPKIIEEFIGKVNSGTNEISIARMQSPAGWVEPGQQPEFDEFTVVLKGRLNVQGKDNLVNVNAGQAIIINAGEWVQYSSDEDTEYIAVCLPAFPVFLLLQVSPGSFPPGQ